MRYSPPGSVVDVTLNADNLIVRDNGPGVTPRHWRELANASIASRTNRYRQRAWAMDCPANHRSVA
ncbi:hypothetical protein ACNKHP_07965 [Shigella boydii]